NCFCGCLSCLVLLLLAAGLVLSFSLFNAAGALIFLAVPAVVAFLAWISQANPATGLSCCSITLVALGSLTVLAFFNFPAFLSLAVLLAAGCHVRRVLPGKPLKWSMRRMKRFDPLFLSNPRVGMSAAASAAFAIVFAAIPIFYMDLLDGGDPETLSRKTIHDSAGGAMIPYNVFLGGDGRYLYATFAHTDKNGFGRTDLTKKPPAGLQFNRYPAERWPAYATLIPDLNVAVVHSFYRSTLYRIRRNQRLAVTHFVDLDSFEEKLTREYKILDPVRSVYDPESRKIYIINKIGGELWVFPVDDFLRGETGGAAKMKIRNVWSLDGLLLDSRRNALYLYGEAGFELKEINLETGGMRSAFLPKSSWDMALDEEHSVLYVSRPMNFGFDVIDVETFSFLRRVRTWGVPRAVCALKGAGAVAVGMYIGNRVLVYDTTNFRRLYVIPACEKVRSIAYDAGERKLYFGDRCGIHVARIPESGAVRKTQERPR
ncbi:MAG: hypothetical protein AB1742_03770, partial [bacterium]